MLAEWYVSVHGWWIFAKVLGPRCIARLGALFGEFVDVRLVNGRVGRQTEKGEGTKEMNGD